MSMTSDKDLDFEIRAVLEAHWVGVHDYEALIEDLEAAVRAALAVEVPVIPEGWLIRALRPIHKGSPEEFGDEYVCSLLHRTDPDRMDIVATAPTWDAALRNAIAAVDGGG